MTFTHKRTYPVYDIISANSRHVETVVILNNKNPRPKSYVEIGIDAEEYYRIKDKKNN